MLLIKSFINIIPLGCLVLVAAGIWAKPTLNQPPAREHVPARKIDFNRDVRPILDKCLSCHGHDPKAIRAGLRLDNREGAIKRLEDGKQAIVPGHPELSALIQRINAKEKADLMPPLSSNRILSESDKTTLSEWVAEGAEYKPHWAFVRPVRPPAPKVSQGTWPRNSIDNFVLEKLESEGLKPSPEADKASLLRRVSLDLTGLPPTPAELHAYRADLSPNAYETVVARLLASPRYGERMAMDWVDCARYADSNGYQNDYERYQYRWRDWVIDAFNQNMPYDEFTVDQLAGDLLPHPTLDQLIATGFNRNNRTNSEGGAIPEEWLTEYVIDRVETTSAVWLGLTTGCARCHDHKYDPISQKEFYSMYSYFNNLPESVIGPEAAINYAPTIKAPYPAQEKELARLSAKLDSLESQSSQAIAAHMLEAQAMPFPEEIRPRLAKGRIAEYRLGENPAGIGVGVAAPINFGTIKTDLGRSTGAIRTDDKSYAELGKIGDFEWNAPFSYGVWIKREGSEGSPLSRMDDASGYRGWDLHFIDGKLAMHLIHQWPENAIKVVAKSAVPKGEWVHVMATYDGSGKAKGVHLYVNGASVPFDTAADTLNATTLTTAGARIGRRTPGAVFTGEVDDPVLYSRELTPAEAAQLADVSPAKPLLAVPAAKRTYTQRKVITREWLRANDPAFRLLDEALAETERQKQTLDAQIPTVMVMREMPKPRDAYILIRGQYDKHGAKVTAGIPAFLLPGAVIENNRPLQRMVPPGSEADGGTNRAVTLNSPNNRLTLAKWIVSPENPLTARVTVNRMWERLFGTGIVETSEDFGTRSSFPSHPELFDWLATELLKENWNLKALWKEMVMSATYRQASDISPHLLALDPANRLLARGPRFRLPAEVVRDQAMFAGGYLAEKIGGRSVRPYQPAGVWDETGGLNGNLHNYKADTGSGLYRRSLYTIWKRTAPPPDMVLFDVPSREICRVRRARTDTPLQALVLMNDVTYLEAARGLAQRVLREGGPTPASRIDLAFRLLLSRDPTLEETRILKASIERRIARYRENPATARALLKQGEIRIDPKTDQCELAAYMMAASTILNMDETVTKR